MSLILDRGNWKRVRFGDVADRSREQASQHDGSIDRYVAGGHFDAGAMKITRYGEPEDGGMGSTFTYVFHPGQVLYVSASWYLRKVGVAAFDGVVADKTYVLETRDPAVLDQRFLAWILLSDALHDYAAAQSTGSMNARLLWSTLSNFEFALPPLDEQKRIADLLWAVERHKRALAVEFANVIEAQSLWLEASLVAGAADDRWPVRRVLDLVTEGPTNGKSATANDERRGVPTLSISAIRDGLVRGGSSVKYMDVAQSTVDNFVIETDDFLVVRGNGNKQLTGRGGLANGGLPEGCVYPDLLIRLRFDPDLVLPAFAAAQWNSNAAHGALIKKAKSTNGIWKINGKDIKSHELVVPSLSEQRALLKDLEIFRASATSVRAAETALAAVRSSFLADVFGGH